MRGRPEFQALPALALERSGKARQSLSPCWVSSSFCPALRQLRSSLSCHLLLSPRHPPRPRPRHLPPPARPALAPRCPQLGGRWSQTPRSPKRP